MNSLKRILAAVRAFIAELPMGHYLLGAVIALVFMLIAYFNGNNTLIDHDGKLGEAYVFVSRMLFLIVVGTSGFIGCGILGIDWMSREFKEENRALRLLSLPLSPAERTAAVLFINWVYLPAITILPAFFTTIACSWLGGETTLSPDLIYVWDAIPITWFFVILQSAFWLFPAIAFPRRVVIVSVALVILLSTYLTLTRGDSLLSVDLTYETASFDATDVVGLSEYYSLTKEETSTVFSFSLPDRLGITGLAAILSVLLLYASAIIGLNRKTA